VKDDKRRKVLSSSSFKSYCFPCYSCDVSIVSLSLSLSLFMSSIYLTSLLCHRHLLSFYFPESCDAVNNDNEGIFLRQEKRRWKRHWNHHRRRDKKRREGNEEQIGLKSQRLWAQLSITRDVNETDVRCSE
jgi:hypothetical protein